MIAILASVILAQAPAMPAEAVLGEVKLGETVVLDVRVLEKGEPSPARGLWMDEPTAVVQARRIRSLENEREGLVLKVEALTKAEPPKADHSWIWGVAAGVALGVGGAYLYTTQIKH